MVPCSVLHANENEIEYTTQKHSIVSRYHYNRRHNTQQLTNIKFNCNEKQIINSKIPNQIQTQSPICTTELHEITCVSIANISIAKNNQLVDGVYDEQAMHTVYAAVLVDSSSYHHSIFNICINQFTLLV